MSMEGGPRCACSDLRKVLCPWGRFRALGTEGQEELSDRERCGAILNQVFGAESPLCHLGATQVGGVYEQGSSRYGWKVGRTFWDQLMIWWSFWVVGRWSGPGVPGTPVESIVWQKGGG